MGNRIVIAAATALCLASAGEAGAQQAVSPLCKSAENLIDSAMMALAVEHPVANILAQGPDTGRTLRIVANQLAISNQLQVMVMNKCPALDYPLDHRVYVGAALRCSMAKGPDREELCKQSNWKKATLKEPTP